MSLDEINAYPELMEMRESVKHLPHKDRKTEIVFIWQHLNKEQIIASCEQSCVSDSEAESSYLLFTDPFEAYMEPIQ